MGFGDYIVVLYADKRVLKWCSLLVDFHSKFDCGMDRIDPLIEGIEFFQSAGENGENIIDVSFPEKWGEGRVLKEFLFQPMHEDNCQRWRQ